LSQRGWTPRKDPLTGKVIGVQQAGERNDTLAGCETGYSKIEFSLAHVADLNALQLQVDALRATLSEFSVLEGVHFLAYGIHPRTPPNKNLLIEQARTAFWENAFRSNQVLSPDEGDDVHLFTVNATNQVHVDIDEEEAIRVLNVLNGFAGAQIALTAHSPIWRGAIDPTYLCVSEILWDWWKPAQGRTGVPEKPFKDLSDYARVLGDLSPVYVKRNGKPLGIMEYPHFHSYYQPCKTQTALNVEKKHVQVTPCPEDIAQHLTFQWFCARISRYQTVENRSNDQQPPEDMTSIAALTLGLVHSSEEALHILEKHSWTRLRELRLVACKDCLTSAEANPDLLDLTEQMLRLAEQGLSKRGLGEEKYLDPLFSRFRARTCPAQRAIHLLQKRGMPELIRVLSL